jgi:hypothetical protein
MFGMDWFMVQRGKVIDQKEIDEADVVVICNRMRGGIDKSGKGIKKGMTEAMYVPVDEKAVNAVKDKLGGKIQIGMSDYVDPTVFMSAQGGSELHPRMGRNEFAFPDAIENKSKKRSAR